MEVHVEKVGACTAKVHVKVPADEFEGAVERAFKNAGRNVRMKGFRAGHVPRKVLERSFGERIRNEAVEHFLQQAYRQAVEEEGLKIVGFEKVELGKLELVEGRDLEQTIEVSLRPEIELGEYKDFELESELEPVLEEEVDAALADFRRQQATVEPAGEEGLAEDGMVLANARWLVGEEVVLERDGLRLSPRHAPPGGDQEQWSRALSGMKQGEAARIGLVFPPDFPREDLRGREGTLEITADEVFRLVPPTDEDLLKALEAPGAPETPEAPGDLRQAARRRLEELKREAEERRVEATLVARLLDSHPVEVPPRMVEDQTRARRQALRRELEEGGLAGEELEQELAEREPELGRLAERGIRTLFLFQAIAEREGLLVGDADMKAELETIAARNQASLEEVSRYYREQGLIDQMAVEILERKVRRFLREHSKVVQPK